MSVAESRAHSPRFPFFSPRRSFDTNNYYDASCTHLNTVLQHYLTAMATTYVDVLMFHHQDYLLDVDEIAACAAAWKAAGTVRYVG